MASVKKITMREYNGTDYDTLYPKTIASQVDGVYTKEESISASTRTALGLATNATPDAALAEIAQQLSESGNVKMEVVWENASPSSSFVAQTVSIPTGYDLVAIHTSFLGHLHWLGKGVDGPIFYTYLNSGSSDTRFVWRNAKFVDGVVTFSTCKNNIAGAVTTTDEWMIPVAIYGIKL